MLLSNPPGIIGSQAWKGSCPVHHVMSAHNHPGTESSHPSFTVPSMLEQLFLPYPKFGSPLRGKALKGQRATCCQKVQAYGSFWPSWCILAMSPSPGFPPKSLETWTLHGVTTSRCLSLSPPTGFPNSHIHTYSLGLY